MLQFVSWRRCAAIVGISLLAACVQQQPPAPPAPAMAAAPMPAAANYQIFYATGKTNINREGQATINRITAAVQSNNKLRVTIVGKTDAVGSAKTNMKLSQKRAEHVRDLLIASGMVPAANINTSWSGESQPDVMGKMKAEPRNRVVDITVQ